MRHWQHRSSTCRRFECFPSHNVNSEVTREVKALLVVDFDGTCSKEDTTCKIVDSAIADSVSRISELKDQEGESNRRKALYDELLRNYVNSLESILNRSTKQVCLQIRPTCMLLFAISKPKHNFHAGN